MSRRSNSPKQDFKPILTPARAANYQVGSPNMSVSSSEKSPESSCLSSEPNDDDEESTMVQYHPEVTSMVLVGCHRCLMYVMLSEVDPKCPQCKSTVLFDFLNEENAKWARN